MVSGKPAQMDTERRPLRTDWKEPSSAEEMRMIATAPSTTAQ